MTTRPDPRAVVVVLALLLAAAITVVFVLGRSGATISRTSTTGGAKFLDLHLTGPQAATPVGTLAPTKLSTYAAGDSPSVLSVLVTDRQSDWLSLAHGLTAIGVPFAMTTDPQVAMRHHVVLAYPLVSGRTMSAGSIEALSSWVSAGGTLIGSEVLGGLDAQFGIGTPVEGNRRTEVHFTCGTTAPCDFRGAAETRVVIGDAKQPSGIIGTVGYRDLAPGTNVLATFDDGSAAVTMRALGKGRAIALGLDVGQVLREGYDQRSVGVEQSYVDAYQPTSDVFLRLLQGSYRLGEPGAVTLSPTANGKELTVMLSHDVDFYQSFRNSAAFANYEHDAGAPSTYFIQAKYVQDWEDRAFLTKENLAYLRTVHALGHEIASHSVSHSAAFVDFPTGSGAEQYPGYVPTITSRDHTKRGTVQGEARVSRYLLQQLLGVPVVDSFRSGYLRNPDGLEDVLQATGYATSSTTTANDSLTHLGFQANAGRAVSSETSVFEVPITIEDQQKPALPKRLGAAVRVAQSLRAERGSYVVLIHPSVTGYKLAFERHLVDAVRPFSTFSTIGQYGAFLRARSQVRVASTSSARGGTTVTLQVPTEITGLTVRVPDGAKLVGSSGAAARQGTDGWVVLGRARGTVTLRLAKG